MSSKEDATRSEYIDGIRKLADWLEANPEVPLPLLSLSRHLWPDEQVKEGLVAFAKAAPKAKKDRWGSKDYVTLDVAFGPVTYSIQSMRENVCERKQVGTKRIEERTYPAHEEPVYEYECVPILALGDAE